MGELEEIEELLTLHKVPLGIQEEIMNLIKRYGIIQYKMGVEDVCEEMKDR